MSFVPEQLQQKTAHGELAVSNATPIVSASSQYGILGNVRASANSSGTAGESGSLYVCTSGTSADGFGAISTRDSLVFRPGLGEKDLFSASFSAGQANSEQFAGLLNTTAGVGFGYNETEFGILFRYGGVVEIQDLTVTTPAAGAENATTTIDGTGYTVPLTAGTVAHNAMEIAASLSTQVPFWTFQAIDDVVNANSVIAQPYPGAFSFTSATAVASWAQVAVGTSATDAWVTQANWSEDTMTGRDDPTHDFDPQYLNNYKIQVAPGVAFFSIFDLETNDYTLVHVTNLNNQFTTAQIENPTFTHNWYAANQGGTVSVSTSGGFTGLYLEGIKPEVDATAFLQNNIAGVSTTAIPLFSFRSRNTMDDVINLSKTIFKSMQVASDATKPIALNIVIEGTLTGDDFDYVDQANSTLLVDTSATAVTGGISIVLIGFNEVNFLDRNISIYPGQTITFAVAVSAAPAADFIGTVSYVEDL